MLKAFIFLLIFPSTALWAQQTDVEFVVQKIKDNYPGFSEKTTQVNFDKFVTETINENRNDSFKMMSKIVDFFHDRHLDFFCNKQPFDTMAGNQNLNKTLEYLNSTKHLKKYEGVWVRESNRTIIAIIQTNKKPLSYQGYVVECRDSSLTPPGTVIFDFEQILNNQFYTKRSSGYSGISFYVHSIFRNDSIMTVGPYRKWRKLNNYNRPLLADLPLAPDTATGRWLDSFTYLITIPGATLHNGALVDTIIKNNPAITTRVQNLIVDIRDNTGGRAGAYTPLLPLTYTNPVLKINGYSYCTKDNIEHTKTAIAKYIESGAVDSAELKDWEKWAQIERDSIGKFVLQPQDTFKSDTIYAYPKHVSYIVNFGCQSAAEMALLEAKQSKKVTLFGEHTMGAVDYLDFYPRPTPSGKYKLYIATTRRFIQKGEKKLDGIGIQPDVFISDSVKDWVAFVKRYYEEH